MFDMKLRFSDGYKGDGDSFESLNGCTFDAGFFQKRISYWNDMNLHRVYVCGPPKMNMDVPKALDEVGVPKYQVIIV